MIKVIYFINIIFFKEKLNLILIFIYFINNYFIILFLEILLFI